MNPKLALIALAGAMSLSGCYYVPYGYYPGYPAAYYPGGAVVGTAQVQQGMWRRPRELRGQRCPRKARHPRPIPPPNLLFIRTTRVTTRPIPPTTALIRLMGMAIPITATGTDMDTGHRSRSDSAGAAVAAIAAAITTAVAVTTTAAVAGIGIECH
jgi:hypothetical protein